MKRHRMLAVVGAAAMIALTGCRREFRPLLEKAERAHADGNPIAAIDALTLALPRWSETDGAAERSRAYELMGLSYQKIQKIEKAVDAYQKALEGSAPTYEAAYRLGQIQLLSSKPNLALKRFTQALEARPNDPLALLGLGNAHYELKNYQTAKKYYQKILAVSPGVTEALAHIRLADERIRRRR